MPQATDVLTLTLTRDLPAPPEAVFDAWVDPAQRMRWWGAGEGMTCDVCEIDARAGGCYRVNMRTADRSDEYVAVGQFLEFDRPRRLVMTWAWEENETHADMDCQSVRDSKVELELEPIDGGAGTRLTLTHTGFATQAQRDAHEGGWTGCLVRLADHLA